MGRNCAGKRGGAEHRGVSAAQPAQLWTAAQQVWLMATCPGRAVAVCGEKRAGRAMGRCAGDHETAWAARGGSRGYISRPRVIARDLVIKKPKALPRICVD